MSGDPVGQLKSILVDIERKQKLSLESSRKAYDHPTMKGDSVEDLWRALLRRYLPERYTVDSGCVIDHTGAQSLQIDLIIFDNFYTPTLFGESNYRYIPAEAVYCCAEIKQEITKKFLQEASEKVESVRSLRRTATSVEHIGGTSDPAIKFNIIGGILASSARWKGNISSQACQRNFSSHVGKAELDFAVTAYDGCCDRFMINEEEKDLPQPKQYVDEGALILSLFRLLRKLQIIGTAPPIDWERYARIFD